MTEAELMHLIYKAKIAYAAMSPQQRAYHDHEQRRSFVRGMCPFDKDYKAWCEVVDRLIPPMEKPND